MQCGNVLRHAIATVPHYGEKLARLGIEPDEEFLGESSDTTSPDVTPDDAKLLQSLLGFFDELSANNSDELRAESADAGRNAGVGLSARAGRKQKKTGQAGDYLGGR